MATGRATAGLMVVEGTEDPVTHLRDPTTEDPLVQQIAGDQVTTGRATRIVNHRGTITAKPIHIDPMCPKATSRSEQTSLRGSQTCHRHSIILPGIATLIEGDAVETEEEGAGTDDLGGSHRILLSVRFLRV